MKKLLSAGLFTLMAFVLSTASFADIPSIPEPYHTTKRLLDGPILPIIIAVVIIAAVILIKTLRSKKK